MFEDNPAPGKKLPMLIARVANCLEMSGILSGDSVGSGVNLAGRAIATRKIREQIMGAIKRRSPDATQSSSSESKCWKVGRKKHAERRS